MRIICSTSLVVLANLGFLLLFTVPCVYAQKSSFTAGNWGIEANYMGGRFLNHGTKYNPAQFSHGFEVGYFKKTLGEKTWHRGMNFPEVGANLTYYSFADSKVFGDAFSILLAAKFYLVRSKVANLYFKLGSGYAYLSRRYNETENPNNTLISSPINMAALLRLGLEWKVTKRVLLNTALSFQHYSNSGSVMPNIGLNMPNFTVGVKVFPQLKELSYDCTKPTSFKRNELIWKVSIGLQMLRKIEDNVPVPKRIYPVPGATIAYARYVNPGNKLYVGLSFEHFPSLRQYFIDNNIRTSRGMGIETTVPSVVLGDEFVFGWVSMFYSAGVYLWHNKATVSPFYVKCGMNFYFASLMQKKGIRFFIGNNVKAHTNVAQYNEMTLGGTF